VARSGTRLTQRPLAVWFGTRVAVAVTAAVATSSLGAAWLHGWYHWDVAWYIKVAQHGYGFARQPGESGLPAFFPGLPLVLRAVHAMLPSWVAAGLVVSLVASAVAAVTLGQLAAREGGRSASGLAVLALFLSPYAVFLAAGYSEALFLAFALPAWLAAGRRSWVAAGLLAALASAVRVTGLFLAVALIVEYAVTERRLRPSFAALLAPVIPLGLFVVHLHHVLGDWRAWQHAESRVWSRRFTAPWTSLHNTWQYATHPAGHHDFALQYAADIAAVALGVALTLYLLWKHSYGEMTYVGLQVGALATSSFYLSVGRATLLWWPLWVLLGRLFVRYRAAAWVYGAVAAPLMVAACYGFTSGRWWVG
jgi:hypothetical protein